MRDASCRFPCNTNIFSTFSPTFFITAAKTGVPLPNRYDSKPRGCECQAFDPRMSGLPCKKIV